MTKPLFSEDSSPTPQPAPAPSRSDTSASSLFEPGSASASHTAPASSPPTAATSSLFEPGSAGSRAPAPSSPSPPHPVAPQPHSLFDAGSASAAPVPPAAPIPLPPAAQPSAPPTLFQPGSEGTPTVRPPAPPAAAPPNAVFIDEEQSWLRKFEQAADQLFPDHDGRQHAEMLIYWRIILPFSVKEISDVADKPIKQAAKLNERLAKLGVQVGQVDVITPLEALSRLIQGKRSLLPWKQEDPNRLEATIKAAEPQLDALLAQIDELAQAARQVEAQLISAYRALQVARTTAPPEYAPALQAREQIVGSSLFSVELINPHLARQQLQLTQWKEDIDRVVYIALPTWRVAQQR
ncbi:hypothetical protein [Parachitinimonas caeni]|uniref:Uncharacterized protein n=1 Tax=Parachitinimonas caeni TaxID=3031301 RepID=A0ABT7E143_9NEIS|nr:hypothetical protein [Parachitinimonas caeni]MDK2126037.1 hypothetical protein [Parachitinimonas caeni]